VTDQENSRRRTVLAGVALSVCGSILFARWPGSDGKTAVALNLANLALLTVYLFWTKDRALGRLLLFGFVFGAIELLADALCVRMTKTLDYSPARSAMLWESPWWMPSAWAVVALQTGYLGAWALDRWGWIKGLALASLMGAIQIPFYEELAYYAGWWRYQNCRMLGHTPLYIIVAEGLIVAGLAPLALRVLDKSSNVKTAALLGALAGLWTTLAGMLGYGVAEFIPNGFRLP
jgi:membrane-bound metal-dependent hydrolase YbcI (DUF457 family)